MMLTTLASTHLSSSVFGDVSVLLFFAKYLLIADIYLSDTDK